MRGYDGVVWRPPGRYADNFSLIQRQRVLFAHSPVDESRGPDIALLALQKRLRTTYGTELAFTYERTPFSLFRGEGKLFDLRLFPEPAIDEPDLVRGKTMTAVIAGEVLQHFSRAAMYGMLGSIGSIVLFQAWLDKQGKRIANAARPELEALVDHYAITFGFDPVPYHVAVAQLARERYAELHGHTLASPVLWRESSEHLPVLEKLRPQSAARIRNAVKRELL